MSIQRQLCACMFPTRILRQCVSRSRLAVSALLFDANDRVVLIKRGPAARDARGLLESPGGEVDYVSSFQENLTREVREELGSGQIAIGCPLLIHCIENGEARWIVITLPCRMLSGEPRNMEPDKALSINMYSLQEWFKVPNNELSISAIAERRVYSATFGCSLWFQMEQYGTAQMINGEQC